MSTSERESRHGGPAEATAMATAVQGGHRHQLPYEDPDYDKPVEHLHEPPENYSYPDRDIYGDYASDEPPPYVPHPFDHSCFRPRRDDYKPPVTCDDEPEDGCAGAKTPVRSPQTTDPVPQRLQSDQRASAPSARWWTSTATRSIRCTGTLGSCRGTGSTCSIWNSSHRRWTPRVPPLLALERRAGLPLVVARVHPDGDPAGRAAHGDPQPRPVRYAAERRGGDGAAGQRHLQLLRAPLEGIHSVTSARRVDEVDPDCPMRPGLLDAPCRD